MQYGFESWEEIEKYLGIRFDTNDEQSKEKIGNWNNQLKTNEYDFVLINLDDNQKMYSFDMFKCDKNYFITSFDMYSLNKGMEIFQDLFKPLTLVKVLFSYDNVTKEEEEYLYSLSVGYGISWADYTLYFQIIGDDLKVMQENERLEKVRFKKLTSNYKDSLTYMVQDITGIDNFGKIKKLMKD